MFYLSVLIFSVSLINSHAQNNPGSDEMMKRFNATDTDSVRLIYAKLILKQLYGKNDTDAVILRLNAVFVHSPSVIHFSMVSSSFTLE